MTSICSRAALSSLRAQHAAAPGISSNKLASTFQMRQSSTAVDLSKLKMKKRRKRTLLELNRLYTAKQPITMLTAYDYLSGSLVEKADIDICLLGDSLAMVACGYENTNQLSMDELLYHCRSVARAAKTPLLVADMPYGSYHLSEEHAVQNALRLVQEGNMEAVKMEGGMEIIDKVARIASVGVPVMGHIGLRPQQHVALSGFRVQGKTAAGALQVYKDALAMQEAGAFSVLIEAVPSQVAGYITSKLSIPTIGIGAGSACAGQVLVQLDMLGGFDRFLPRFAKQYMNLNEAALEAIGQYAEEVRSRKFPDEEQHTYPMAAEDEYQKFVTEADKI